MNVTPDWKKVFTATAGCCNTNLYNTQTVEWYVYHKRVLSRTGLKKKNYAYKEYYAKSSLVRWKKNCALYWTKNSDTGNKNCTCSSRVLLMTSARPWQLQLPPGPLALLLSNESATISEVSTSIVSSILDTACSFASSTGQKSQCLMN